MNKRAALRSALAGLSLSLVAPQALAQLAEAAPRSGATPPVQPARPVTVDFH